MSNFLANREQQDETLYEHHKFEAGPGQKPLRVEVDESLLSEEKAIIEEAILDAMKSAHEISTSTMKERMEDLTGGFKLNLPGMGDEN